MRSHRIIRVSSAGRKEATCAVAHLYVTRYQYQRQYQDQDQCQYQNQYQCQDQYQSRATRAIYALKLRAGRRRRPPLLQQQLVVAGRVLQRQKVRRHKLATLQS